MIKGGKISEDHRMKLSLNKNKWYLTHLHPMLGKKRPDLILRNKTNNPSKPMFDSDNPQWKDDAGRHALHRYIKRRLSKPDECPSCGRDIRLELCNISPTYNPETYTRKLENWYYSCRKCHMNSDGRMNNLLRYKKK